MHILFSIILLFLITCLMSTLLNYRRKTIIKEKMHSMCLTEKCSILNKLIEPMGFHYQLNQDIFTSLFNAWQRTSFYCALFDEAAAAMNKVYDCEPIYFDYNDKTWVIVLRKGQFGISTGCEVGFYCADAIIPEAQLNSTLFHCIPDSELMFATVTLYKKNKLLLEVAEKHWNIGGLCMGIYSEPNMLSLNTSITFKDYGMMSAFMNALFKIGYTNCEFQITGRTIILTLNNPLTHQPRFNRWLLTAYTQWKNHHSCSFYLWLTRPYQHTADRLLYLYYYLPSAFHRIFRVLDLKKQKGES